MNKVDITQPVFFYDDKGKSYYDLKSVKKLYNDEEIAIFDSLEIPNSKTKKSKEPKLNVKMIFNFKTGECYLPDYQFWVATNQKPTIY